MPKEKSKPKILYSTKLYFKNESENAHIILFECRKIPKNLPTTSETSKFNKVRGYKINIEKSTVS